MQSFAFLSLMLLFTFIGIEDFKSRTIRLLWPILVCVSGAVYAFYAIGLELMLSYTIANFVFISTQAVFLILYFVLKHRKWIVLTDQYIGWGDVLFMIAIIPLFSIFSFVLFYLSSLILSILIVLIYKLSKKEIIHIPLAGVQAFYLGALICWNQFISNVLFLDRLPFLSISY